MPLTLPNLPYDYSALEPFIDGKTMELHHGKHHKAYVDKANAALDGTGFADKPIEEVLANLDKIPEKIREAVRNNGGGAANHNMFWTMMSPRGGGEPSGKLKSAISSDFGGFSEFKGSFSQASAGIFGSGWAWLVLNNKKLEIIKTANQDSPLSKGLKPILCLDVWEHAYYLKYQNRRPEYIEAWWNVVDWEEVGRKFGIENI